MQWAGGAKMGETRRLWRWEEWRDAIPPWLEQAFEGVLEQGLTIIATTAEESSRRVRGRDLCVRDPFAGHKVEPRMISNGVSPVVSAALTRSYQIGKVRAGSVHDIERVFNIPVVTVIPPQGFVVRIRWEHADSIRTGTRLQNSKDTTKDRFTLVPLYLEPNRNCKIRIFTRILR